MGVTPGSQRKGMREGLLRKRFKALKEWTGGEGPSEERVAGEVTWCSTPK